MSFNDSNLSVNFRLELYIYTYTLRDQKYVDTCSSDFGQLGLARSRRFNSSQVEVRALCRPVKFFDKPFLYGPCFVHRGIVMLNTNLDAQNCLECHCML